MNAIRGGLGPRGNEELESQLSAMFDDELPAAECELLARRLSRDEQLKARWGRYAIIGAAIRAERGVRLQAPGVPPRVKQVISAEPALSDWPVVPAPRATVPAWWQPLAGAAVAAGVAMGAILWLRSGTGLETVATSVPAAPAVLAASSGGSSQSVSYVAPPVPIRRVEVPSTSFANYVVAHFEVASPVAGQAMISALVAGDAGTAGAVSGSNDWVPVDDEDVQDNAKVE